jgi:hypothetical protein
MLKKTLVLAAMFSACAAWAAPETPAPTPGSDTGPALTLQLPSQRFAHDQLMEMANFLGNTQRFSALLSISYDVVQDDGQKIEFAETRKLTVERPDHVLIQQTSSDGAGVLTLFDGESVTVSDGATGLYAQGAQPGDIDASVVHFVRDLKMRLPLAPILMSRFADELQRRLTAIDHVEQTTLFGKPAHHIAGRTANADFQVWIAAGKNPLPQRIVMTYKHEPGQPQFRADFTQWNLAPKIDKTTFKFKPAKDAQRIVFAVQVVPVVVTDDSANGQNKGEQK